MSDSGRSSTFGRYLAALVGMAVLLFVDIGVAFVVGGELWPSLFGVKFADRMLNIIGAICLVGWTLASLAGTAWFVSREYSVRRLWSFTLATYGMYLVISLPLLVVVEGLLVSLPLFFAIYIPWIALSQFLAFVLVYRDGYLRLARRLGEKTA